MKDLLLLGMRGLMTIFLAAVLFSAAGQLKSTRVYESGEPGLLSPSIAINHRNVGNLILILGSGKVFHSADSGATWKESPAKSPFGAWGQPSIVCNLKGEFAYVHSSNPDGNASGDGWLDRIVGQKSDDGGETWTPGVAVGLNAPKDQVDPQLIIHPKHGLYLTWVQYDKFGLQDQNCQSHVMFSKSSSANKWSRPVQLSQTPGNCEAGVNAVRGATPAVNLEGRIYVIWANQDHLFLDRSYDGGENWLTNDLALTKITSTNKAPGGAPVPSFAVDASMARTHGTLSVVFSDQRNGENDSDVWYYRSTNSGDNWAPLMKINTDGPGKHQFRPAVAVDPMTGHIFIVYYDRRNTDDDRADIYLAHSSDGGNKFTDSRVTHEPFMTGTSVDAISIMANAGVIAIAWTQTDGGKASVYTTVFKEGLEKEHAEKKKGK